MIYTYLKHINGELVKRVFTVEGSSIYLLSLIEFNWIFRKKLFHLHFYWQFIYCVYERGNAGRMTSFIIKIKISTLAPFGTLYPSSAHIFFLQSTYHHLIY